MSPVATPPSPRGPSVPHGPFARFLTHPDIWWRHLGHDAAHLVRGILPVGVPALGALLTLLILVALVSLAARRRALVGGQLVEVAVPPTVEAKAALGFWRNVHSVLAGRCRLPDRLFGRPGHVAFEVDGSEEGVSLRFWVPSGVSAPSIARAVSSAWPGAQCQIRDTPVQAALGPVNSIGELRLAAPAWLALGTDHALDPLRTVVGALPVCGEVERGRVQILVRPARSRANRWLARSAQSLQMGRPTALVPRLLAAWQTTPTRQAPSDPVRTADVRHAVAKAGDLPAFEVVVRYGLFTAGHGRQARRRVRGHAKELSASFGVFAGRNHLVAHPCRRGRRRLERRGFSGGQVLGLSEVAALAHLPSDRQTPGLAHASAAAVAPPPGVSAALRDSHDRGWDDDDDGL